MRARFAARAQAILATANANSAYWGALVADRDTGEVLYELNSDRFFAPGSNAKILTTALALATLGGNYQFRTTLESRATLGSNGHLQGDLVFMGRGDPDLSNRVFPYAPATERSGLLDKSLIELADAAVAKGLREIDGDIVADDSYFPYDPYPAGWETGDLFFDFGSPRERNRLQRQCFRDRCPAGRKFRRPRDRLHEPCRRSLFLQPRCGDGRGGFEAGLRSGAPAGRQLSAAARFDSHGPCGCGISIWR